MATLEELAAKYRTDKLDHNYLPHYAKHLDSSLTDQVLLEIGVAGGASLRMWQDYYPTATIIGIDDSLPNINHEGLNYIVGDGTKAETYNDIDWQNVYVVIDDASHQSADITKTFDLIWDQLPNGAWYVIEDLGTQFSAACGGDPVKGSTALTMIKQHLHMTLRGQFVSEFHAYEEIVFLKKK